MTLEEGYKIVVEFIDENDQTIKLDKSKIHAYFTFEEHQFEEGEEAGKEHAHDDVTVKTSRKELNRCHEHDF